jgi:hypothetical protein
LEMSTDLGMGKLTEMTVSETKTLMKREGYLIVVSSM